MARYIGPKARVSRRLVLMDDQVPPPNPLDDLRVREHDHQKLIDFLRAQGFTLTRAN